MGPKKLMKKMVIAVFCDNKKNSEYTVGIFLGRLVDKPVCTFALTGLSDGTLEKEIAAKIEELSDNHYLWEIIFSEERRRFKLEDRIIDFVKTEPHIFIDKIMPAAK